MGAGLVGGAGAGLGAGMGAGLGAGAGGGGGGVGGVGTGAAGWPPVHGLSQGAPVMSSNIVACPPTVVARLPLE